MKRFILYLLFSAALAGHAQPGEFATHGNGLIYSDTTMRRLHHIVDSMNLKFRACDPWKQYYALSQARGHFIEMDTGDVTAALNDMKAGLPYQAFRKKYPLADVEEHVLVTRSLETHDWGEKDGKSYACFRLLNFNDYDHGVDHDDVTLLTKDLAGCYVYDYTPSGKDVGESVTAFYFPEAFAAPPLTTPYARMVQYADCMIDTGKTIFFKDAISTSWWYSNEKEGKKRPAPEYAALEKWLNAQIRASTKEYTGRWFFTVLRDSIAKVRIVDIGKSPEFRHLFTAACNEAIKGQAANEALEYLADKFGRPDVALHLKRLRIVVGGCSMDQSPRYHALDIARLSAETINWEIFLRAHLDIMNDNFQRMSDGSYAWGRRQTYIRELEELDFDVETLLLGISLRISNPSGYHYYGSISRIGRALAEYHDRPKLEARMASMISDKDLDLYNRIMIYFLYRNYQYYRNEQKVVKNDALLTTAINTLPDYIQSGIAAAEKKG